MLTLLLERAFVLLVFNAAVLPPVRPSSSSPVVRLPMDNFTLGGAFAKHDRVTLRAAMTSNEVVNNFGIIFQMDFLQLLSFDSTFTVFGSDAIQLDYELADFDGVLGAGGPSGLNRVFFGFAKAGATVSVACGITALTTTPLVTEVAVDIDIKPGSDPNCFNINGHGVVPVAVLGSEGFNVSDIDQSTLSFSGLSVRVKGNQGPQCSFDYSNSDEFLDLICQFEDNVENWLPGSEEATVTGQLLDGTAIKGTDSICVVP